MENMKSSEADKWVEEKYGEDCAWIFSEGLVLEKGMTLIESFPDTVITNYFGTNMKGVSIVKIKCKDCGVPNNVECCPYTCPSLRIEIEDEDEDEPLLSQDDAKCWWCNARGCDTVQNGNPIHAGCA